MLMADIVKILQLEYCSPLQDVKLRDAAERHEMHGLPF